MKRLALLWLTLAIFLLIFVNIPIGFQVIRFYRLAHHSHIACGIGTAFEPQNHMTLRYEYEVGGRQYSGSEQGYDGPILQRCNYPVHYLPGNPSVALVSDPAEAFENEAITLALVAAIMPTFFLLGCCAKSRAFRVWLKLEPAS